MRCGLSRARNDSPKGVSQFLVEANPLYDAATDDGTWSADPDVSVWGDAATSAVELKPGDAKTLAEWFSLCDILTYGLDAGTVPPFRYIVCKLPARSRA